MNILLNRIKVFNSTTILIVLILMLIVPAGMVVASELGGYWSELLIDNINTLNSQLNIGGESNSILDIMRGTIGISPDSGEYRLNSLLPLILMGFFIIMLLRSLAHGQMNILTLIIVVVLIYLFYALFPGIQDTITRLLGGEGI